MPHSSGGGSFSGGSHFGGSHSSHSGSGSSSSRKLSRNPFAGAVRYRYITRRGRNRYYYALPNFQKTPLIDVIIICAVMAFMAALSFIPVLDSIYEPQKLIPSVHFSGVTVKDRTDLIDRDVLTDPMQQFFEATGVSPAVEFVFDDEVTDDPVTFAYSRYTALFHDETHWLIEVMLPRDFREQASPEWRWEGMIGDNCYPAVSREMENRFTEIFQKHLEKASGADIEQRLADAWSEIAVKATQKQIDPDTVITCAIILFVCMLMIVLCIFSYRKERRLEIDVPDPEPSAAEPTGATVRCEHCGAEYDSERELRCPKCGLHNPKFPV